MVVCDFFIIGICSRAPVGCSSLMVLPLKPNLNEHRNAYMPSFVAF